ncbi:MAG: toxin TcdB middle/N-terminal domain-containing protein, partial [Bacteroidota bacterium]
MEVKSGIQEGLLSNPSGGGAMQSLGERFQPDLLKGSGTYSVPIRAPKGPNELSPSLTLRYSTGLGNGLYGLGWQLAGPLFIMRRSDKGIPTYGEEDEFILGGGEVLVPVGDGRYQARSETQFWDIRRVGEGWVIRSKDGRRYQLGQQAAARIEDRGRIYAWMAEEERDPAGNVISFRYEREAGQLYLSQVAWSIYRLQFLYEDRPDVIHNGRAGFPIKTRKRGHRIELHCKEEASSLLQAYEMSYTQATGTKLSLLTRFGKAGFGPAGEREDYPPLDFRYSQHQADASKYLKVTADHIPPPLLDSEGTTLVDMDGDGLPDILQALRNGHRYWRNKGNGRIGEMVELDRTPLGVHLEDGGASFTDLHGDGSADLLQVGTRLNMAITNTGEGRWAEEPVLYKQQFPLQVSDASTRFVDLDGNGVPDLLQSGPHGFTLAYNQGGKGWSNPEMVARQSDINLFPNVSLGSEDIYLADMTGDGLSDIVYLVSGQICYWPYYGYGRWGAKEEMKNAVRLPRNFSRDSLFLTDLDGDGVTDLLYVDHDRIYYWMNQSGVGWSNRFEIPFVPPPQVESVYPVDLLGKGTRGLLWSLGMQRSQDTAYRFLDLSSAIKPYLLVEIQDGFGGVTEMFYESSTDIRQRDEASGEPWDTYLPFPLQVVDQIKETDKISGMIRHTHLRYHRGYFDPAEKVFRGFERVTMTRDGDEHSPTVQQVSQFYLGSQEGPEGIRQISPEEQAQEHALSGSLLQVEVYELAADGTRKLCQSAETIWEAREEFNDGEHFVYFPRPMQTDTRYLADGDEDKLEQAVYEHDDFGNVVRKQMWTHFESQAKEDGYFTDQQIDYSHNEDQWLVGIPVRAATRDQNGHLLTDVQHFFDGDDFKGLPLQEAEQGILKRKIELVYADWATPNDFASEIDPTWGLTKQAEGWYRQVEAFRHDPAGNVEEVIGPLGERKTIAFDGNRLFPTQITSGDGQQLRCRFDPRTAQALQTVANNNIVTEYRYSPLGRLIAEFHTHADGSLQLIQYFRVAHFAEAEDGSIQPPSIYSVKPHNTGQSLAALEAAADLTRVAGVGLEIDYYDCQGNLLQRSRRGAAAGNDPNKQWVRSNLRRYCLMGQRAVDYPNVFAASPDFVSTFPEGGEVSFFYDNSGKSIRVEHPDGVRYRVDYYNTRIEKWDAGMSDAAPPIVERYTAKGYLHSVEHPLGGGQVARTTYEVDHAGRVLNVQNAQGHDSIQYTYAGPSAAIRIVQQEAGSRTYWRDANGKLRLRTDSLGRRLGMEYDEHGRVTRASDLTNSAAPQVVREFAYDGKQLLRIREGSLETTFENDLLGRPLRKTIDYGNGHELTLGYRYGLHGEVRSLTYPDGTVVEMDYYLNGSMKSLSGFVDETHYNANENPEIISFDGTANLHFGYDPSLGRVRSMRLESGGNDLRALQYQYDQRGQINRVEDRMARQTFGRRYHYDDLYRLVQSDTLSGGLTGQLLRQDHYGYNLVGDILQNEESGLSQFRYEDAQRPSCLTSVRLPGQGQDSELVYDEAGRLLSFDDMETMTYDIWDRLTSVRMRDGREIQFQYDHVNRRLTKSVVLNGQESQSRYVESLYEEKPSGSRLNVYLGRLLVARVDKPSGQPEEKAFVLTDHLGSLLSTCTVDGRLLQEQAYTPFGRSMQAAGTDSRYIGLAGDDELGMVHMGARHYHPLLGRFTSPDWFVVENPNKVMRLAQGFHVYSYAINNPIMLRDPSGLWFGLDDLIVAAVGFVVGFFTGLIVGLAQGRSFGDSLLLGLEAGLLGAVGAWLAYATVGLALAGLGVTGGWAAGLSITAAAFGGLNGVISGATEIYDWSSWTGWATFLSDSTWGILGTSLGVALHITNLFYENPDYQSHLSKRQNRHVYDGGFGIENYALTQGNVVSNLQGRHGGLLDHETLHITQNRIFGPIFQTTYVGWMIGGFFVALVIAPFTDQGLGKDIYDISYVNNPWEAWAY